MKNPFAIFATSLRFVVWRARIIGLIVLLSAGFQLLQARHAQANTVNITATVSGAEISALIAFDNSGNTAAQFLGAGTMQPGGQITNEVVAQFNLDGHTCTVPGGAQNAGSETTLVGDAGIVRFGSSGDLLYTHATSGSGCIDVSSGTPPFPVVASESGVFTGGTGKYAGATGSFTLSAKGSSLALPGLSGTHQGFGFFEADQTNITGTLTTP